MMTSKSVISDNHPVLIYYDIMTRKRIVQRLQDVSPSIKLLSLSFKKIDTCPYCRKPFYNTTMLNRHLKLHIADKRYKCQYKRTRWGETCSKSFNSSEHLKRHVRTHTGERPFKCEYKSADQQCGKKFSCSGDLKRHMRTHTGEKPYICRICNKTFSLSQSRNNHLKIHC